MAPKPASKPPARQNPPIRSDTGGKKEKVERWGSDRKKDWWKTVYTQTNAKGQPDYKTLLAVRRKAHCLDTRWNLCGFHIGVSAFIGLIPALGDLIDFGLACHTVAMSRRISGGLGAGTTIHMVFNIILDLLVGVIPLVGDLADVGYKANTRNARLLEDVLFERYKVKLNKDGSVKSSSKPASRDLEKGIEAPAETPAEPEAAVTR